MSRSILLVLLACLLIVGVLGALDVIPLGLGGGGGARDSGGAGDLLEVEGADAATLKGRGEKPGETAEADPLTMEPDASAIPAEVRGTTPNGAVVRGRVVRADGRIPLAGVGVEISRPDSLIAYLRAEANGRYDELTARTGADGRFAFLDVTPSQGYVVRAYHEGYAACSSSDLDLRGRESVDVGDLELGAGGGLSGLVLDASKNPVAKAWVAVTWRIHNPLNVVLSHPETAPELEREAETDAQGRFTVDTLEPGPKTVFVVAPNGASDLRRSVTVEAGTTKAVADFVLPGPGYLAGHVLWKNGEPIPGARVFAKPWNAEATHTVDTDAAGHFRIDWLAEGRNYGLGVLVEGLPIHMEQQVELGRDDLRIEFDTPGVLTGTVVRAKSGKPITRFAVALRDEEQESDFMLRFLRQQVRNGLGPTPFQDPTGAFRFPRTGAGTYTVRVTAVGYPETEHAGVVVTPGETTSVRIEIPDGNVGRGTVVRSAGTPIAGARVYVLHTGVRPDQQEGVTLTRYVEDMEPDAVTRGDGSFALPPMTPGRYDVIATHEDTLPGLLRGLDLRAGDASDLEIRLPPSGGVRGRLLDEHARPVKGAERIFILYPEGIVRLTDVEEDGRFEVKGLPVGRCLVRWLSMRAAARYARVLGGKNVAEKEKAYDELRVDGDGEHEIVDGGMVEVPLRLPRRVRVTGRVITDGEGGAIQAAWLSMAGAPFWIQVEFDADGRYEKHLEPGKYNVWVQATNAWKQLEIEIPDVASHQLDLQAR